MNGAALSGTPRYRQIVTPQITYTFLQFGLKAMNLKVAQRITAVKLPKALLTASQAVNTFLTSRYQIVGYDGRYEAVPMFDKGTVDIVSRNATDITTASGDYDIRMVALTANIK